MVLRMEDEEVLGTEEGEEGREREKSLEQGKGRVEWFWLLA